MGKFFSLLVLNGTKQFLGNSYTKTPYMQAVADIARRYDSQKGDGEVKLSDGMAVQPSLECSEKTSPPKSRILESVLFQLAFMMFMINIPIYHFLSFSLTQYLVVKLLLDDGSLRKVNPFGSIRSKLAGEKVH